MGFPTKSIGPEFGDVVEFGCESFGPLLLLLEAINVGEVCMSRLERKRGEGDVKHDN